MTSTCAHKRQPVSKATEGHHKPRKARKGAKPAKTADSAPTGRETALTDGMPDPYMLPGAVAGLQIDPTGTRAALFGLPLLDIAKRRSPGAKAWRITCRWLLTEGDKNTDTFFIPYKYKGPEYRAVLYAAIKQMIICYLTPPEADPLHPADSQVAQ